MKRKKLKRSAFILALLFTVIFTLSACSPQQKTGTKIPVRVLILPKFEVGGMTGDYPGEAQDFYEGYLDGGKVYDIKGLTESEKLYYKNGVALCLLGEGKVAAALNTSAVLSDERFDFSRAYILSTGCGGTAEGYGTFGDVFVISAAADYDLGHQADPREMGRGSETTWFHDESFDPGAFVRLDRNLTDRVFGMVEDVTLDTTEKTLEFVKKEYPEEAWAQRPPRVMRGTSVSGDNYWKGVYDHQNALLITETYNCPDPFAITEMEDVAVGLAVKRFGMLDRLIVLRAAVNLDVFPAGVTPEMLWGAEEQHIASINSIESVDIFETAMKNCFKVGKVLIDAILEGKL